MGKYLRKAEERLAKRRKDFDESTKTSGGAGGYKRPGSMKKK